MRSWHVDIGAGIDGLTIREHPDPVPGPGQVLLAVRAAAVDVAGLLGDSLKAVKVAGHVACVGFVSETARPIDPWAIFGSGATVCALAIGSRAQFLAMNQLIEQERIRPVVDRSFPFDQAREAFRYYASGSAFGKVIVSNRG